MKKLGIIISLFFILSINVTAVKSNELIDIATFTTSQNYIIDQWNITIKEKIPNQKAYQLINLLQEEYSMTTSEDKQVLNYHFKTLHKNGNIIVVYRMTVPKNRHNSPQITVTIKGDQWSESILKKYQKISTKILHEYFTKQAKRYTCVTATSNDIINDVNFFNSLEKEIELKNISTQFDTVQDSTHKKIIYGYTPIWDNEIEMLDQYLNVQMVFKNTEEGKSKIILGTPILINEY